VTGGNIVTVFQESGGAAPLVDPVLLILGVPNDTTNLFATDPISGVTFTNPFPGGATTAGTSSFATGGTYGLKSPAVPGTGFFGDFTSGQIYDFLTLQGPTNSSNHFADWAAADLTIDGITAKNFGIYVFDLSGGTLDAKGDISVSFSQTIPQGTFAVAYGQNEGGKVFDTPITEAALLNLTPPTRVPVPEPGTMVLFGSALAAAAGALRGRRPPAD